MGSSFQKCLLLDEGSTLIKVTKCPVKSFFFGKSGLGVVLGLFFFTIRATVHVSVRSIIRRALHGIFLPVSPPTSDVENGWGTLHDAY